MFLLTNTLFWSLPPAEEGGASSAHHTRCLELAEALWSSTWTTTTSVLSKAVWSNHSILISLFKICWHVLSLLKDYGVSLFCLFWVFVVWKNDRNENLELMNLGILLLQVGLLPSLLNTWAAFLVLSLILTLVPSVTSITARPLWLLPSPRCWLNRVVPRKWPMRILISLLRRRPEVLPSTPLTLSTRLRTDTMLTSTALVTPIMWRTWLLVLLRLVLYLNCW